MRRNDDCTITLLLCGHTLHFAFHASRNDLNQLRRRHKRECDVYRLRCEEKKKARKP